MMVVVSLLFLIYLLTLALTLIFLFLFANFGRVLNHCSDLLPAINFANVLHQIWLTDNYNISEFLIFNQKLTHFVQTLEGKRD